jgi:adenylylsulfate kinase-like enzyme
MNEERGFTLWFTGLSGAGKTTIAEIVERELRERGRRVEVLDGDIVRTNLSKGLSFSRRIGTSTCLGSGSWRTY